MLGGEVLTGEESRLLAIGSMELIDTGTNSTLKFEDSGACNLEAVFAGRFLMTRVD